ncbi:MAG: 2-dehydropantoate 2-reductase [Hyphomicrobiaceae bacterium]|nr:2-dehydropantoate 2-reductase [Hyphomicrobiaceae bacterium]
MRILVVGAGAIGGYFGARLSQAGRDVTFLVRPRRAALLAQNGLRVRSPAGDISIAAPATVTADKLSDAFDLIILSCKAYDLNAAIADVAPAIGPHSAILPLLNGMRHIDVLEARFGGNAVLGGQCVISTTLSTEGTIVHLNTTHSLTYGERDGGASTRVNDIRRAFEGAAFDATASPQILQAMWEKWVVLASMAGATSTLRAPIGVINRVAGGRDFVLGLIDEVGSIAAAAGFAPRPDFLDETRAFLTNEQSPQTSSMFRDIENGARIEADHIIGDLLMRASGGLACERLTVVYAHLKAYETRLKERASD